MPDHTTEIKKTIQPWIVSLGISVFCCALFFAVMSNVVGKLNATLDKIDARLATIESQTAVAASAPVPVVSPINVMTPQPVPPSVMPDVQVPSVNAPPSSESGSAGSVPSAAPAPEAIAPVLPSVPPSAAPITTEDQNKL